MNNTETKLPSIINYLAYRVDFEVYERLPDESRERLCNKMAYEVCNQRENRYMQFNEARILVASALTEISENRDKYAEICASSMKDRARESAIAIKTR